MMRPVKRIVDLEHALFAGAVSMVMTMNDPRLSAVLAKDVFTELDHDGEDRFGPEMTVEVDGVPRYRIVVEAIRE